MIQLLRDLWRKRRGTASIEFAVALPALVVMFMGVFEVSQALIVYMKVIDVADTVSDLIAQQSTIASSDIDNYYIAGQLVMTPSAPAGLRLAVASVTFDPVNPAAPPTVAWHVEEGGAAAMGDLVTAVSGLGSICPHGGANPCDSVIVAQAGYTYNSALSYLIQQPITMSARVFSRPRAAPMGIPCTSLPNC
jgi:Flp pilus assembly protein TadG